MKNANTEQPEPLWDRAKVAMVVLALVLLTDLNAILADLSQISLIDDVIARERISLAELEASDNRFATAGILQMVATLLAAVTFLLWFSRAYKNSVRMGARPRYAHGWAIGSWFLPIVNLIVPKQLADDIWRGSDPDEALPEVDTAGAKRVNPLLHFWWAAWVIGGLVGNFAIRSAFRGTPTPEGLKGEMQAYLVSDLIFLLGLVLAVLVIREITTRQEARRARFESGTLTPPAWPPPSPRPLVTRRPEPEVAGSFPPPSVGR
jgi:hypothetical protein